MPTLDRLTLSCPAKVNLALSVGAVQPTPMGLRHPVASWMVAVRFADELALAFAPGGPARLDIAFAPDAPVPGVVDWPLAKDLAWRAHGLLQQHVGRELPVRATLQKRIPTGAGLGGGSSDAAAMLVGVNRLLDLGLDGATLRGLAIALGSDVAFLIDALLGRPSALVTGLGETLEELPLAEVLHLVLILPGFGCPTAEVYQAFDRLPPAGGTTRAADAPRVRALAAQTPLPQAGPFNDLAEPACVVRPELARIRTQLHQALQLPIHVTGSGSTLFAVAPSNLAAQALARQVTALTGLAAVATCT